MCLEEEIPLDAIQKTLPAVWKMKPQLPSAGNDKKKKIPVSISQETLLKRGSFTPHKWRNGFTGTSEYSNTCCKKGCSSPCRNHSIFLMDCHECGNM